MSAVVQNLEGNFGKPFVAETPAAQNDLLERFPGSHAPSRLIAGRTFHSWRSAVSAGRVNCGTACHHTSDVPLRVNELLIGWTEFEVVGDRLAVRISEHL